MPEPLAIEVHKALAEDTRYRLYRYLRLSGRPVAVRELATRLSLHPRVELSSRALATVLAKKLAKEQAVLFANLLAVAA